MKLSDLHEAITITLRNPDLTPLDGDSEFDCNNGEFYMGSCPPDAMLGPDRKRLEELGWTWSNQFECWSKSL